MGGCSRIVAGTLHHLCFLCDAILAGNVLDHPTWADLISCLSFGAYKDARDAVETWQRAGKPTMWWAPEHHWATLNPPSIYHSLPPNPPEGASKPR